MNAIKDKLNLQSLKSKSIKITNLYCSDPQNATYDTKKSIKTAVGNKYSEYLQFLQCDKNRRSVI